MRFFDCSGFIKPEMVQEPLPSNRSIIKRTLDIAMPSTF